MDGNTVRRAGSDETLRGRHVVERANGVHVVEGTEYKTPSCAWVARLTKQQTNRNDVFVRPLPAARGDWCGAFPVCRLLASAQHV